VVAVYVAVITSVPFIVVVIYSIAAADPIAPTGVEEDPPVICGLGEIEPVAVYVPPWGDEFRVGYKLCVLDKPVVGTRGYELVLRGEPAFVDESDVAAGPVWDELPVEDGPVLGYEPVAADEFVIALEDDLVAVDELIVLLDEFIVVDMLVVGDGPSVVSRVEVDFPPLSSLHWQ
jgi:hypothetical protein